MMPFEFKPAPPALIDDRGRPVLGVYAGPIHNVNLEQFPFRRLQRFPWTLADGTAKMLAKKWQFVGVVDEALVMGAAVVDVKYIGTSFAYVYDRQTKELTEINLKSPFASAVKFSPSAAGGKTTFIGGGKRVEFSNDMNDGWRSVVIEHGDKLSADFRYKEIGSGITSVSRTGLYGFNHCYKMVAMPAEGEITYAGKKHTLSKNALALLDWSTGVPQRETFWNWACGSGKDSKGRMTGLNFACGMNETSYTENTFWLDGQPEKIDTVNIDYNQDNVFEPWHLTSMDNKVDLMFYPDSERYENQNYLLIVSRLHQPFGRFEGSLNGAKGKVTIDSVYGFCEEHFAKW